MPIDEALISRLEELLSSVRLRLERDGDAFAIGYERERHPLSELPLDDVHPDDARAELLAVAAGLEAAVKFPGEAAPGESLRDGAATLLPRLERRRFVRAYHAVVNGRGDGDGAHLVCRDVGGDLVTCYVHDEGWRFAYIVQARARAWDTTLDTIHSVARSNLYARAPIDHRVAEVAVGDGYDASRVTLIGDVFYDRGGPDGLPVAVPGRDLLLVGPDLDPAAVRSAYAAAKYPLSPHVLRFHRGQVHPA